MQTDPFSIHVDVLLYPHIIIIWIIICDFEFIAFLVLSPVLSTAGFIVVSVSFLTFAIRISFVRSFIFGRVRFVVAVHIHA